MKIIYGALAPQTVEGLPLLEIIHEVSTFDESSTDDVTAL
jgi:hypothetical protein